MICKFVCLPQLESEISSEVSYSVYVYPTLSLMVSVCCRSRHATIHDISVFPMVANKSLLFSQGLNLCWNNNALFP